ncbi:Protein of unknown function [Desulfocicer vacuolatum DSM 3385]|uniref:DUF3450 domain-containing protein n=1 Tax=Desulfocicer vacuolatum DSM 3385 TaxID=1121400 RepID=A0A1W1YTJ4_9BACT|nr:DUF3450 domain-containing protein [Desulfocicer vacuolatum]SMC39540.1 Protein of unknown function [Desulfocicer vacuolatum DSM 3385]
MKLFLLKPVLFFSLFFLLTGPWVAFCSQTAEKVKKKVDSSIATRQKTQKQLDRWEQQKAGLVAEYEQLKQQQELLAAANVELITQAKAHRLALDELMARKEANLKIQKEMLPFLKEVYAALEEMVLNDAPFLREERRNRLQKLALLMDDVDISIAEKYRKVMEALCVEAEYGNTIEVTQDKIELSGSEVLADIFRLGRISLFALTLDQQSAGVFNVAENRWDALSKEHLQSVAAAVEMGKKQRTVEVMSLPIGQLAN